MGALFAGVAAVFAWVGWFFVAPAFGFPSLGPAAMFNRVAAPRADSGYWLGWALLLLAMTVAVLVYLFAVRRRLVRAGIVSGLVYGAVCWLVAGVIVMPLLGFADTFPVPAPPASPDAMHGTLMMLHLGIGAPLAALIGWLVFGTVLGTCAEWRPSYSRPVWAALFGSAVIVAILTSFATSLPHVPPAQSGSGAQTLSTGAVATLPSGPVFISVFRLPQPAGAALGPHAHVPGFCYVLRGVETMTFADAPTAPIAAGQAGFMSTQQLHTHINVDDRLAAGAVGLLIVVAAAVVAFARRARAPLQTALVTGALLALIALGGLATWNPWSNDWLFISIRPVAARGGPMPLPSASRVFESTDLGPLPAGPYTEAVEQLTVEPGPGMSISSVGAGLLLVVDGQAQVLDSNQAATSIGLDQGALVQPGSTSQVTTATDRPVRLIYFSIAPAGS